VAHAALLPLQAGGAPTPISLTERNLCSQPGRRQYVAEVRGSRGLQTPPTCRLPL
jgi:hypothetical protein